MGDLEVGGQLGLTTHSVKDGPTSNTTKLGAYAIWGRAMGNGRLELTFNPQYHMA